IRPKSRATVVVVLPETADVSSMPIDLSVISASVTSGSISEMAPTKVVLPTPKPPLMTILTAMGCAADGSLERPDTVPDPFDQTGGELLGLFFHGEESLSDQVGHDHADHAERSAQRHGKVRHRHR